MLSTVARNARHKFGRTYLPSFSPDHYPSADDVADQIAEDEEAVLSAIERCGSVEPMGILDGPYLDTAEYLKELEEQRHADRIREEREELRMEKFRAKSVQEQTEALKRVENWSLEFSAEGRRREEAAAAEERKREQVHERIRAFMNRLLERWGAPEYFVGCGPSNKGNVMLTGHLGTLIMTRGISDPEFWRSYRKSLRSLRRTFKSRV